MATIQSCYGQHLEIIELWSSNSAIHQTDLFLSKEIAFLLSLELLFPKLSWIWFGKASERSILRKFSPPITIIAMRTILYFSLFTSHFLCQLFVAFSSRTTSTSRFCWSLSSGLDIVLALFGSLRGCRTKMWILA